MVVDERKQVNMNDDDRMESDEEIENVGDQKTKKDKRVELKSGQGNKNLCGTLGQHTVQYLRDSGHLTRDVRDLLLASYQPNLLLLRSSIT